MVTLENIASQVGPGFFVGFGQGFIISITVALIRGLVRLFKRIVK